MHINAFSFFVRLSFTLYYIELDYVLHTHAVHKISNNEKNELSTVPRSALSMEQICVTMAQAERLKAVVWWMLRNLKGLEVRP